MSEAFDADAWAKAYITVHNDRASLDEDHPDYLAAYEFMCEVVGDVAENCWTGILAVVRRRPSDWVLGMLAAGPMEDLLQSSGDQFIERIEAEAKSDPVFKEMMTSVWESGSAKVWTRFEAARDAT